MKVFDGSQMRAASCEFAVECGDSAAQRFY